MAIFDDQHVYIIKDGEVLLHGNRDPETNLYMVNITSDDEVKLRLNIKHMENLGTIRNFSNNAYEIKAKKQLIMYYHRCCFSPVISTWITAIEQGNFCTWSGLTATAVKKYMDKSMATSKGHMQQQRKNLRTTQRKVEADKDIGVTTNECYFAVTAIASTGKTFSDQTGRFPVTSSKGNKYIMIMYDYDSNSILGQPMKSRTGDEILRAFTKMHEQLKEAGLTPKLHRLDNECPTTLKFYMKKENISYQLVPPHIHRRNTAEKAISTFKDHFIAGLASVSPKMPMHLWCRLLPQAFLTLNLMRQSRINPKLSAYAQLHGIHD